MAAPLISIALCTYNGEKYITEQLQSILDQIYNNLEIVIVDDVSSDNTFAIVTDFANKDSRIKRYRNEINLGYNKNFEKAISLTTGEYIAISDQDDIWKPNKIQALFDNIGDGWLIFSNSVYIDDAGKIYEQKILENFKLENNTYKSILLQNWVTGHTTLFKRDFLNYCLPFPADGFYDWWMGFIATYHHKIKYIDEVLTHYRKHQDSVIQQNVQVEKEQFKKNEYHTIIKMLNAFAGYEGLSAADKTFISALLNAMLKMQKKLSMPFMRIIYKYYEVLFPNSKKRNALSKLNFAYKFSKKV